MVKEQITEAKTVHCVCSLLSKQPHGKLKLQPGLAKMVAREVKYPERTVKRVWSRYMQARSGVYDPEWYKVKANLRGAKSTLTPEIEVAIEQILQDYATARKFLTLESLTRHLAEMGFERARNTIKAFMDAIMGRT